MRAHEKINKLLRKHKRDFERTHVDPQILHSYDTGGKLHWKQVENPWKEPVTSTKLEKGRNFLGMLTRVCLASCMPSAQDISQQGSGHSIQNLAARDESGVLAVDMNGVRSQSPELIIDYERTEVVSPPLHNT